MQLRLGRLRSLRLAAGEALPILGIANGVAAALAALGLACGYFGATSTGHHYGGPDSVLDAAYHSVVGDAARPQGFPSKAQVEAAIAQSEPELLVLRGTDAANYRYLRGHSVGAGALYVRAVDKTHLDLVARYHKDAIRELEATIPSEGPATLRHHGLYTGRYDWLAVLLFIAIETGILNLIGLLIGAADGHDAVVRQRRWLEVVNDSRLGPATPERGHRVLLPVCVDEEDKVRMQVQELSWSEYGNPGQHHWQEQRMYDWDLKAHGLQEVVLDRADGVAAVTGRWFEFCAQVAAVNAQRWREELAKREQRAAERRLATERQRLADAEAAVAERDEAQQELSSLLPPARALMSQALDAQPLGD